MTAERDFGSVVSVILNTANPMSSLTLTASIMNMVSTVKSAAGFVQHLGQSQFTNRDTTLERNNCYVLFDLWSTMNTNACPYLLQVNFSNIFWFLKVGSKQRKKLKLILTQ